jgi:hypothetical protein
MSLPTEYYFSDRPDEFKNEISMYLERMSREMNGYSDSFVPYAEGATSAGSGTYSTQKGFYFIDRNFVDIFISIIWSAHSGTGNLRIVLPFISQKAATDYFVGSVEAAVQTYPSSCTYATCKMESGTRYMNILGCQSGGGSVAFPVASAANFKCTIRYPIQSDQIGL